MIYCEYSGSIFQHALSVSHISSALLQSTTTSELCYIAGCRGEGGAGQTCGRTVCSKEQLYAKIRSSASPMFMLC